MKKPSSLKPGAKIGIVSPASPVPEGDLEEGIALIEARGYRVEIGKNALAVAPHCNYLAGTDAQRASDLQEMLNRTDIDAVFCSRGGYGSMRLFDFLDWDEIARNLKIFVGYSDITSLHSALANFGWVTFHSPMVSALPKLDALSSTLFWNLLEKTEAFGILPTDLGSLQTVVSGVAEGELIGGNLTLLAQACGSKHAPDFRGKLVLIEDVNGAVYHADRDLAQLKNAGLLNGAAGFILGTLTGWEKHEDAPPQNFPDKLWQEFFAPLGKPAISGFPFGHIPNALSLPLGVRARLNADEKTLTLLQGATRMARLTSTL